MCLDRLTVKRTLNKDKKVWKVSIVENGREYSGIMLVSLNKKTLKAEPFKIYARNIKYDNGFHCLPNRKTAKDFCELSKDDGDIILHYIIPKGTKVQYGYQRPLKCGKYSPLPIIVTPVLINPRIK